MHVVHNCTKNKTTTTTNNNNIIIIIIIINIITNRYLYFQEQSCVGLNSFMYTFQTGLKEVSSDKSHFMSTAIL